MPEKHEILSQVNIMHLLNTLLALILHHPGLAKGAVFLVSLSYLIPCLDWTTGPRHGNYARRRHSRNHRPLEACTCPVAVHRRTISDDGVSYWMGHHFQERQEKIRPFSRYPEMLKKVMKFMQNGGIGFFQPADGYFPKSPAFHTVAGKPGLT